MSRILGYSRGTIIRRKQYLATKVIKPIYFESNQEYEVDELWTFVCKNQPANYCWIAASLIAEHIV